MPLPIRVVVLGHLFQIRPDCFSEPCLGVLTTDFAIIDAIFNLTLRQWLLDNGLNRCLQRVEPSLLTIFAIVAEVLACAFENVSNWIWSTLILDGWSWAVVGRRAGWCVIDRTGYATVGVGFEQLNNPIMEALLTRDRALPSLPFVVVD